MDICMFTISCTVHTEQQMGINRNSTIIHRITTECTRKAMLSCRIHSEELPEKLLHFGVHRPKGAKRTSLSCITRTAGNNGNMVICFGGRCSRILAYVFHAYATSHKGCGTRVSSFVAGVFVFWFAFGLRQRCKLENGSGRQRWL